MFMQNNVKNLILVMVDTRGAKKMLWLKWKILIEGMTEDDDVRAGVLCNDSSQKAIFM